MMTDLEGLLPCQPGTIHGASFVYAPGYVQITGTGDFTKMNVLAGDDGGEVSRRRARMSTGSSRLTQLRLSSMRMERPTSATRLAT